jgi:DNA-binding winged helix-turn-helix (wHTH) protein/predicted ATPase
MPAAALISFPPFWLDPVNKQLRRGTQPIALRPKPFAILQYLVERPGQLVTKEELLKAVWPDTCVSEGLLNTYIHDLRAVLGDDPAAPRFIETVVRRGYRFIAPLTTLPVASPRAQVQSPAPAPALVGRETELAQLYGWLERAVAGERQVVFVTGEPGIGKTTLVDAFLHQAVTSGGLWIGRGQCIEHYGAGEAYLPLLKAFGRLGRESGGERLIALLNHHAPTWLLQMPALLSETDLEALQHKVQGTTRDRMLREFAELVEAVSAEQPLVLTLEDLHWSDPSTLYLLTLVAQRREAARVLVLGTYRPADVIVRDHPLRAIKQELHAHRQCEELALGCLSEAAVRDYLAVRFPGSELPAELARLIYRRTEGNPLFMVNVVDYLVMQGVVHEVQGRWQLQAAPEAVAVGIPDSLRQLIERQLERLPREEQRILEVASVAGPEFSAMAVAAGVEAGIEQVEARCEGLLRRGQFLHASGTETVPDGTLTGRYSFIHALYQSVLYERAGAIQRTRLHRRIGERIEAVYGTHAREIAVELAVHFEQGQDYPRAVQYLEQAAQNALQRSAHRETIQHLTKALELLKTLPDTPERAQQELTLQIALGAPLIATKNYSASEVGQAYGRARELCQQLGDLPQLFPTLYGLTAFAVVRGELRTAHELSEQLLRLAHNTSDSTLLAMAHRAMGTTLFYLGEFTAAREHFEQVLAFYDLRQHRSLGLLYAVDPKVVSLIYLAQTLWYLGYPDQASGRIQQGLSLAQELAHPYSWTGALCNAAWLQQYCGDAPATQASAEAVIALASEQGFSPHLEIGRICRGWAVAVQGRPEVGLTELREGLAAYRATQAKNVMPYHLALLGEVHGKAGQIDDGLAALAEVLAIVNSTEERQREAELYRLKGELSLQSRRVKTSQDESRRIRSPQYGGRGRSVFPQGHRDCPQTTGEVAGTAHSDELGSAVAATRQKEESPPHTSRGLRLVHRRI